MFSSIIRNDGGYGVPGMPGNTAGTFRPGFNVAGNPFGSEFVIPSQHQTPRPGGPQLNPLQQTPTRVFPKDQPGREGAVPVQAWQAMMQGLAPMGNAGFYMGPQYGQQVPAGFQNKIVS